MLITFIYFGYVCVVYMWIHVCICIDTYVCGNQRLTLNLFFIAPTHTLFIEAGCLRNWPFQLAWLASLLWVTSLAVCSCVPISSSCLSINLMLELLRCCGQGWQGLFVLLPSTATLNNSPFSAFTITYLLNWPTEDGWSACQGCQGPGSHPNNFRNSSSKML